MHDNTLREQKNSTVITLTMHSVSDTPINEILKRLILMEGKSIDQINTARSV